MDAVEKPRHSDIGEEYVKTAGARQHRCGLVAALCLGNVKTGISEELGCQHSDESFILYKQHFDETHCDDFLASDLLEAKM